MFHKVKAVSGLTDYQLSVQFAEGVTKIYDMKPLFKKWKNFNLLRKTPFDGLIAFTDATQLWDLNESTLRKAVSYGKLINGIDVCKYGKQWIISADAMVREYGPAPKQLSSIYKRKP